MTTFSRESTRIVLDEACDRIGVSHDGAELLRLGENAIYCLSSAPLVVRIARSFRHWDDATKEVAVAKWLSVAGVPAAQVWPVDQPLDVAGYPVTFWRYIAGRRGGPGDVRVLGRLLRRVHELPAPADFRLPAQDPLQRVRPRIEAARVAEDECSFLLQVFDELLAAISELEFPLPEAVNHGDAHVQNLMITDGRAELIDFEGFCWGHPEWDLAMGHGGTPVEGRPTAMGDPAAGLRHTEGVPVMRHVPLGGGPDRGEVRPRDPDIAGRHAGDVRRGHLHSTRVARRTDDSQRRRQPSPVGGGCQSALTGRGPRNVAESVTPAAAYIEAASGVRDVVILGFRGVSD